MFPDQPALGGPQPTADPAPFPGLSLKLLAIWTPLSLHDALNLPAGEEWPLALRVLALLVLVCWTAVEWRRYARDRPQWTLTLSAEEISQRQAQERRTWRWVLALAAAFLIGPLLFPGLA